jgi:hypothetical protein
LSDVGYLTVGFFQPKRACRGGAIIAQQLNQKSLRTTTTTHIISQLGSDVATTHTTVLCVCVSTGLVSPVRSGQSGAQVPFFGLFVLKIKSPQILFQKRFCLNSLLFGEERKEKSDTHK